MLRQNFDSALPCGLAHAGTTGFFPGAVITTIEESGIPDFSKVLEGVVGAEIVAAGTNSVDDVEAQIVRCKVNPRHQAAHEADEFIAGDDHLV